MKHHYSKEKSNKRYTHISLLLLNKFNGFRDIITHIMSMVKHIETIQYYQDIHKKYDFNLLFSIKLLYPGYIFAPVINRIYYYNECIPPTLKQRLFTINKMPYDELSINKSNQYLYSRYMNIKNNLTNFINSNGVYGGAFYSIDNERVLFAGYHNFM